MGFAWLCSDGRQSMASTVIFSEQTVVTMDAQDAVKVMCERIVAKFHPLQIILFGSRARGDNKADSDIDLLVVMPTAAHYRETVHAIRQLVGDMPVAKDILVVTPGQLEDERDNTAGVIYDALVEGKVVYERPS